ncbi:hypothetical protein CDD81_821 [Ophiocordyceps australis]|uniref:RRM domain-containing protein n=1 Tax=Ophiocordyceps australis TaxID=1399860 RepID=A0A2C5Y072_9HYPO|nr:hypothetical protein CDD81_821 [Ophiocordyceps australis]
MASTSASWFPRRADATSSTGVATHECVTIARTEYDSLVDIARKYENLCHNLTCGGVGEATIQLLSTQVSNAPPSQAAATITAPSLDNIDGRRQRERLASSSLAPVSPPWHHDSRPLGLGNHAWDDDGDDSSSHSLHHAADVLDTDATDAYDARHDARHEPTHRAHIERKATRTLILFNLPDGTTHADITSTLRGGLLLDIYIKNRDNTAVVSFLHGADARAFFDHVRHNGLHVKRQKVDVKWHTCQFTLAGSTAHKIGLGATRNLVIRHHSPNLTERQLRHDLEHIHNLVVISVHFLTGDCHISTNSVHNAIFARLCLMSRREYKGSRIEWGPDECAQPLDHIPKPHKPAPAPAAAPTKRGVLKSPTMNRFRLLDLEQTK